MNHYTLSQLCKATYGRCAFPVKCKNIELIADRKTDTQVFVMDYEDKQIFSFRGTERKWKDVLTDVMAWKKTIPYGNSKSKIRVHTGFLRAFKSVRNELVFATGIKKTVITGHSLGGALARLFAVDYQYHTDSVPELVTFGTPKLGNKAFERSFARRLNSAVSYINRFDIVPTLPPFYKKPYLTRKTNQYGHNLDNYARFVL